MRRALIAFLVFGFLSGFAATMHHSSKKQSAPKLSSKKSRTKNFQSDGNFDFLYGQWELLNAQGITSRKPSSNDESAGNFVFEEDIYVDSALAKANGSCNSGVEFEKYALGQHRAFLKEAKKL